MRYIFCLFVLVQLSTMVFASNDDEGQIRVDGLVANCSKYDSETEVGKKRLQTVFGCLLPKFSAPMFANLVETSRIDDLNNWFRFVSNERMKMLWEYWLISDDYSAMNNHAVVKCLNEQNVACFIKSQDNVVSRAKAVAAIENDDFRNSMFWKYFSDAERKPIMHERLFLNALLKFAAFQSSAIQAEEGLRYQELQNLEVSPHALRAASMTVLNFGLLDEELAAVLKMCELPAEQVDLVELRKKANRISELCGVAAENNHKISSNIRAAVQLTQMQLGQFIDSNESLKSLIEKYKYSDENVHLFNALERQYQNNLQIILNFETIIADSLNLTILLQQKSSDASSELLFENSINNAGQAVIALQDTNHPDQLYISEEMQAHQRMLEWKEKLCPEKIL